jgi:prolyl 4-hydroxylase
MTPDRQAEMLASQGRVAEAFALLETAIAGGDGLAALTLANWRMAGALIRRDLDEARRLYGRAAELGVDEAAPVHIAMLANGAGGSGRRWGEALALLTRRTAHDPLAQMQTALIALMALDEAGNPLGLPAQREVVHDAPRIERLPEFLTADECRYVADMALPRLAPAVVFDPATGQQRQDPVRSAHSTGFPFVIEDPVLHAIGRRIAKATGTRTEQGEPLQVLSYQSGQEYKLHSDALPGGDNQRVATFLVTLSDGFQGGATVFPRLGLQLNGKPGDGLFFLNTDAKGQPDPAMWHAGMPVSQGRKLMLSRWIREKPLDLSGPPGRPF